MKVNFAQEFKTLKGETIIMLDSSEPLTLKTVAAESLIRGYQGESLTPDQSLKRLHFARKIEAVNGAGLLEITTEEATELKTLIARAYAPLIAGQAAEMIEAT